MPESDIVIDTCPAMRGRMSVLDLIGPEMTMTGGMDAGEGLLFRVFAPEYALFCEIHGGHLHLHRNGAHAKVPVPPYGTPFIATIAWSADFLQVRSLWGGSENEHKLPTAPTFPPHSLRQWARNQAYLPTPSYQTPVEVFEAIVHQLQNLRDLIVDSNTINGFWNVEYRGNSVVSRRPKKETDIHPQIRLQLCHIEATKGLQVVPEYLIGSGRLDFLITGRTAENQIVNVCVEFKSAHAPDLAHGLEVQLPEYMARVATDFGVYCVLDFGSEFPHNARLFDLDDFPVEDRALDLTLAMATSQNKFVKAVVLDLSRHTPPSKMEKR